jgi:hypothetical protein
MYCTHCGHPLGVGDRFCAGCGTAVAAVEQGHRLSRRWRRRGVLGLVAVVALAVVALLVALVLGRSTPTVVVNRSQPSTDAVALARAACDDWQQLNQTASQGSTPVRLALFREAVRRATEAAQADRRYQTLADLLTTMEMLADPTMFDSARAAQIDASDPQSKDVSTVLRTYCGL